MKTIALTALLSLTAGPLLAETGAADLKHRCAEQERQIRELEQENERLRSMLERSESSAASAASEEPATSPVDLAASEVTAPVATPVEETYTVQPGDMLARIARNHGTTTGQLAKLNGISDPSLIRVGQKLRLPLPSAPARESIAPAVEQHEVAPGETLYAISRRYGLSVASLQQANPQIDPRALKVGQVLRIASTPAAAPQEPASAPGEPAVDAATAATPDTPDDQGRTEAPVEEPSHTVAHQPAIRTVNVEEEITFGQFASTHGTNPSKLNALNGLHLTSNTVLAKGSELYVPAQP